MSVDKELKPEQLRWKCGTECFSFSSTDDLPESHTVIGQDRAVEAIEFGMGIDSNGFNIYVMGPSGAGRTSIVKQFVEEKAKSKQVPDDWCYVFNFEETHKPSVLRLPAGKGKLLRDDMDKMLSNVKEDIKQALEREDYEKERNELMNEMQRKQSEKITEIEKKAREQGFTIQRGPQGFMIVPLKDDGEPMNQKEIAEMEDDKRKAIQEEGSEIQKELQDALRKMRNIESETKDRLEELEKNTILFAVEHYIEELKEKYGEHEKVSDFLDDVKEDLVKNAQKIAQPAADQQQNPLQQMTGNQQDRVMDRYKINLVVDNSASEGAPVITEMRPSFNRLIGKLERKAQLGMLYTDFNMIKPGVLHQANGGYLIMEAMHLFQYPFSYNVLKNALKEGEIKITDSMDMYQAISTESLEPEPIPLDIKVILIGNPMIYYLLQQLDEEFKELFKVKADFNTYMERNDENIELYARFIASRCAAEGWSPFDTSGVSRMVEYGMELTGDQTRLSTKFSVICDLAREADYLAKKADKKTVTGEHVQQAIDAKKRRSNKIEEIIKEMIERGDVFIDTERAQTGQVNGLSVADLGDYMFGRPSRITARTYIGRAGVVNIDREVKMSGPIHNKGVLILTGFLNGMYGQSVPLSLSASLVFEQSYEGVDGDSASSTELYALLSSLSEIPLKQNIAVTGSVNQQGEIQPVGGVTQKVEGFFDVCRTVGLTGDQGVMIPAQNVKNLMLKQEVVDAVEAGKFHLYPVNSINEGIEILTGKPFGERQKDGSFPEGTVSRTVEEKLLAYAEKWNSYNGRSGSNMEETR